MRFRKLRIAWSVAWGVVAVLLVVLWVRSYRVCDVIKWQTTTTRTDLFSATGAMGIQPSYFSAIPEWGWYTIELLPFGQRGKWEYRSDVNVTRLRFPHRLPVTMSGVLAVLDTPTTMAFLPPHPANRHDAGCRGARGDCLRGAIVAASVIHAGEFHCTIWRGGYDDGRRNR